MPTMVAFPTIVQEAVAVFGQVCDTEAARRHCAEYLTGLMIAERKTVRGINREFALTTDPACLHRWLTAGEWDVQTLHDRRWAWWQQGPHTRYSARGVIAIDNTLVDHAGQLSADGGGCWEHADERHGSAHAYLIAHSGWPSGAPSPSEWRRVKKREVWPEGTCKAPTALGLELSADAGRRAMPGACPFDRSCTSTQVLNHIQSTQRAYGGDVQLKRQVVYVGREQTLQEVARQMPWAAPQPVRMGRRR